MMYDYKVVYLASTFETKKMLGTSYVKDIDGRVTARELEALIMEQHEKGYNLFSITPLVNNPNAINTGLTSTATTGFMVTFKERKE